jgi:hypothetical protein
MSKSLNTNSRFAILAEETNNKNVFNKKKKTDENNKKENNNNNRKIYNNKKENNSNKINNNNKEANVLINESFPELSTKVKNKKPNEIINIKKEINFIDKVNFEKVVIPQKKNNSNELNEDIEPGWVEISFNPKTREFTRRYNLSYIQKNNIVKSTNENKALNALIETHKKRTQEYINMWGYEEWEKMFRFPDYDYEYFDRLDEAYENEINNINNMETQEDLYYSE